MSGSFPRSCLLPVLLALLVFGAAGASAQQTPDLFAQGENVYAANCASCHRGNGQGLPNVFPALAQNSFVTGAPQAVIDILLNGRRGTMGRMPAWQATLNDAQIAAVITYIRQQWGNKAEAVTPEQVAAQRRPQ